MVYLTQTYVLQHERSAAVSEKTYIAIDLKSFFASVECVERGLDPLTTNLVVADESRTEKTICLAVSPSLKAYGIGGRARLFEVVTRVKEVNALRRINAPNKRFSGCSSNALELNADPSLELDYIVAPPHMSRYMRYSTRAYNIYLKYIAPDDIHVYSIDEVFIDATPYLKKYGLTARELAMRLILDVLDSTGVTATAGIGTNMYLAKVALDIGAKHIEPDANGVRIAELDELSYRRTLWDHTPITDFWRVGRGYAQRLSSVGLHTMGDVARCSMGKMNEYYNEELLYKLFGVNAELLIDHAWGWESCTIADIKAYTPDSRSISSGQVLQCPYDFTKARIVVHEMAESMALELVDKGLTARQIALYIGYDTENLKDKNRRANYSGQIVKDNYGREIPKQSHGTASLARPTASTRLIAAATLGIFDKVMDKTLLVRRLTVAALGIESEEALKQRPQAQQIDMFTDCKTQANANAELERERHAQQAMLSIKKKFGKNAILKGMNLREGATARERNHQIGGHKE